MIPIPIGILFLEFCKSIQRGFGPRKHNMKHQKYNHYPEVKNAKLNARAEAAVDFLAAIAVGIVLAVLLAWRG